MTFSLKFKLEQPNTITINQLLQIAKHFDAKLQKEDLNYALYLENPNEQLLQDFGNFINAELSNSIFIKDIKAEYTKTTANGVNVESLSAFSTPCKNCMLKLKAGKLVQNCEICNSYIDEDSLSLKVFEKIFLYKEDSEEFFQKFAQILLNGGTIQTNHNFCYFNTFKDNFLTHKDRVFICKDLNSICKYFTTNEQELKMLASVEKPILNLNAKEIFVLESKLPIASANVRLANNQVEFLLFSELDKSGIDIICYSDAKNSSKVLLNASNLYHSKKLALSKNSQHFYTQIDSKNIDETNAIVFDISKSKQSSVVINKENKKINLLTFEFNFKSFAEIFSHIEEMDEKGKVLMENFKTKMPLKYEQLLKTNIANLHNNIEDAFLFINAMISDQKGLNIYENACNYKGTSGGKLDFKIDSKSNVSLIWTIRTVISYLLAGASSSSIACAVFESMADFFTQIMERYQKEYEIETVIFHGSMFEEKILFQKSHELISKNYTINRL